MTYGRKSPADDGANFDRFDTQDDTIVNEIVAARRFHLPLREFKRRVRTWCLEPIGKDDNGRDLWSIRQLDSSATQIGMAIQPELDLGGVR